MSIAFTPAIRSNVNLIIGLAGASGSGKTFSAFRLASGIANGKRFAVVDTENGRARHYADAFAFDVADIVPPFRPSTYIEAIEAADKAGYPVIIVDSASHEHAGDGGLLDWHEEELERMAGDDWQKRDRCSRTAWIKPKGEHKRMMQKLLRLRAHLILCFRAEEKVDQVKDENGKWKFVPKKSVTGKDGWMPICEKSMPYELTVSMLLTPDRPGVPLPIKLQEQHKKLFPLNQPITEDSGRAIAEWAAGGSVARSVVTPSASTPDTPAKALAKRWGQRNRKQAGETNDAYRARFIAWASASSGVAVTDPAQMDEEAIDRCNIVLDDIEQAAPTAA